MLNRLVDPDLAKTHTRFEKLFFRAGKGVLHDFLLGLIDFLLFQKMKNPKNHDFHALFPRQRKALKNSFLCRSANEKKPSKLHKNGKGSPLERRGLRRRKSRFFDFLIPTHDLFLRFSALLSSPFKRAVVLIFLSFFEVFSHVQNDTKTSSVAVCFGAEREELKMAIFAFFGKIELFDFSTAHQHVHLPNPLRD